MLVAWCSAGHKMVRWRGVVCVAQIEMRLSWWVKRWVLLDVSEIASPTW